MTAMTEGERERERERISYKDRIVLSAVFLTTWICIVSSVSWFLVGSAHACLGFHRLFGINFSRIPVRSKIEIQLHLYNYSRKASASWQDCCQTADLFFVKWGRGGVGSKKRNHNALILGANAVSAGGTPDIQNDFYLRSIERERDGARKKNHVVPKIERQ